MKKIAFVFISLFFLSFQTPEVLSKMVDAVYIPESVVVVEGVDNEGVPVVIKFDKKKNSFEEQTEIPFFFKLFFFPSDHTAPETMVKASKKIAEELKAKGVKTENCIVSAIGHGGEAAISIGKERRFSSANELTLFKNSYLPQSLTINEETTLFSDYHKSVLPAAFPGKIEFYSSGNLVKTWTFYRKEHQL
ncbi:MAG: hypothetical protein ACOX2F_01085 [bacterium]